MGRAMEAIPPEQTLWTFQMGLYTNIAEAKYLEVNIDLPSPGDWEWTDSKNCKPCGQPNLRPASHPGSYYTLAARKSAEGSANVREQLLDALLCVSVMETAMITSIVYFF